MSFKKNNANRFLAGFLAIVMMLSMIPLTVFAASSSAVTTNISEKEFVVGVSTEFTITTTANDDQGEMVIGTAVFSDPSAIEKLEYYEVQDGNWYELAGDFGPADGFPMSDATSTFRVTFKKAGIYSVEIFIKSVEDSSVVCSTTATAYVTGSSSFTTDAGNKTFVVGEATEFTFTTVANEDAGKMVIGTAEFSNPDAIDVLEYYEVQNDTWYPLEGDFGPATGFPMSNATSTFRVTFKQAGTYTLTAYMKEVETGDTLCFAIATVKVKDRSAISFTDESIEIKYSDVNASNSSLVDSVSGAEYTYKSNDEDVVKVNEYGILTPVGIGETTITVTRKENSEYVSADATYTVKVVKGVQGELTWDKTVPDSIKWNDHNGFSNTVSGGSGNGDVTYSCSNTAVADVNATTGVLTLKKPGTVTITATKDGGTLYEDQTTTYTLVVIKSEQEALKFEESNPDAIFYGDVYTNIATGGSSSSTIKYESSDPSVASVDENGKVTANKNGVVTITATLKGDDYYEDATPVTYSLTVYRADQKTALLFSKGVEGQMIKVGYNDYANIVSGGDTSPITYSSSNEAIAKVDPQSGLITPVAVGTVTITATAPQTEQYNALSLSYDLEIGSGVQSVEFEKGITDIPAITWGDSYQNKATAKTAITYSSSDVSIADIDENGNLLIYKAGTVTITANATATSQYDSATASYTITINKASQTVTFELGDKPTTTFNVNNNVYINKTTTNAIEAGENIVPLYSIASGEEFVDGEINETTGEFKIKGAGTIVINVVYESNGRYKLVSDSYTLTVARANQTISFPEKTYSAVTGEAFTAPVATESGEKYGEGTITYAIKEDKDGIIKSIDDKTGELVFTYKAGTATIIATKAADDNYNATTAEYTITTTEWSLDTNTEYYKMTGTTVNDSGWFTGNVSVEAADGYVLSYVQTNGNATWENVLTDAVTAEGNSNTIIFYVKEVATGKISAQVIETIRKDTVAPTASIEVESLTSWEKFLSIISFGTWDKDTADFTINSNDITSQVDKVEYYVVYNNTELLDKNALDAVSTWTEYNSTVSVDKDSVYVVYAKVTDTAGNYVYATTNGIVFDGTNPEATITLPETSTGYYTDDVDVNINVKDAKPYSGIKTVSYKIFCDNVETDSRTIYDFADVGITDPKYSELVETWDTSSLSEEKKVVVNAVENNSDNVRIEVTVVDNAGNSSTVEKSLKISAKDPEIAISYIDDPASKGTNEGVVYYDTNRKAKIVITGRTTTWDDTLPVINITAVNSKGESIVPATDTYEISGWATVEGEKPDDATHTAYITFKGSAKYNFTVDYTDKANRTAVQAVSNTFVVDHNKPTGSITVKTSTWDKLLNKLTFGLWSNESVIVSATSDDETSAIKSVEYFKSNGDAIVTTAELDNANWTVFEGLKIDADEQFTVYLKITDYAGHYTYISTDGYIVDMTDSIIALTPDTPNANDYYNSDVDVDIVVKDASPYSGIKKVEYWVTKDGVETQRETLYSFKYVRDEGTNSNGGSLKIYENGVLVAEEDGNVPTKAQLKNEFTDTITVIANDNNSDNVKVYVQVTDNAGNVSDLEVIDLKIDKTAPKIDISYDTDAANVVGDRGFFKTTRQATIKITERTTAFNKTLATNGITITGVDANDEPVVLDLTSMIDGWDTTEGATPDEAVHTATIDFTDDANYTFDISYTDEAGNVNVEPNTGSHVTPYKFTVDKTDPTATISVAGNTWDTLLNVLTFGLWKNETVYVSATSDDETSATDIKYYKTDSINPLTHSQLKALEDDKWTPYTKQIEVANDERFTVYLKVTDTAGNFIFINNDGYVVDKTKSQLTLTPDTPNANNIYNKDVKVLIDVKEPAPYSGIKKVEYWVTKDGVETQRETLYSFEYERNTGLNNNGGDLNVYENGQLIVDETGKVSTHAQLKNEFSQSITVDSALNNSSDVKVYVGVTDNAGNYVEDNITLDIDITAPTINVTYDNNEPYKIVGDRGYFPANRTATVVITERTNHFDASDATERIKIKARDADEKVPVDAEGKHYVDSKGNRIFDDNGYVINPEAFGIAWNTVEGETPDEAKHTTTISYAIDANYDFEITYTDKADNGNKPVMTGESVTPYHFTVDKVIPTGTVKVGELGTWDTLIEILTFGLWSKDTVSVSGTSDDVTSPIESVSYYKTSETTAKTADQLAALDESSWTKFTGFDVPANEQFTVYIRIVDFAGNITYISTNGIIVDSVKPEFKPALEETKPEITLAPVENDLNGLYKDDVTIAVKVVDPITGETYSGLKEIRYEITNMGVKTQEGVLYGYAEELGENIPTQDTLRQVWEKKDAIVVKSELNNSNDVKVKVYAVDNADNNNEDEIALKIDVTKPTIDITYDNNDGDTNFTESTYFKANRTATIVITERNFNKDKVEIKITNSDEVIPTLSGWKTEPADGNGDGTKHTATITYSADGDYTFAIAYTDEAGNDNEKVNYGDTLAPEKFTVDKTLPTVTVTYDNNEALNGNYYKAQRIATIVVTEHNFETSRVKIALKATDNGVEAALPAVSNWSSNGNVHTATITYAADSLYTFDFDYTDKAGNATADIAEQTFYVDKTNPVVSISKIVDQSANNDEGNIGFVVTATDTNFDVFTPVLTVTDIKGESTKLSVGATTDIANGKSYSVENLDADGIYRITCTVVDKAGNAFTEVTLQRADGSTYVENRDGEDTLVTFSVNRDGSTYEINADTADLIKKYYVQNVTDNVVIIETNADPLTEYKVTLNGKELTKDTDYTVTEEGGNGSWIKYTYSVNEELFANEGEYKIVVSSKDKAENDAFSDVKDATVNFVVDRTAPIVTITGMAKDGRYQTESQKVTLVPTDDGGALKTLIVRLVDEDGKVIGEPIIDLAGEALEKALEDGAGKIEFTIAEGMYQNIQIICNDCAVDEDGKTNTYDETITNVTVTPNGFMIFWANKHLRWGSIAGVILLTAAIIFFIIFKKRKKEEQK